MPRRKLSNEILQQIALKYMKRSEFQRNDSSAYSVACRRGILDDICKHMESPYRYLSNIELAHIAKKYKNRLSFQRGDPGAFQTAYRRGILDEICKHMTYQSKHSLEDYTKKKCLELASKCDGMKDFEKKYSTAFWAARTNGWLYDVRKILLKIVHWNKTKCKREAQKYMSKKEFSKKCSGAYQFASRHGFLDDICKHMKLLGNYNRRKIYAFEFADNTAYVGLSYNPEERKKQHLRNKESAVFIHLSMTQSPYVFKVLSSNWLNKDDAAAEEKAVILQYKNSGWTLLNRAKGGSLGCASELKYKKEQIIAVAQKYDKRWDFQKEEKGMYLFALKHGWLDEVCSHMKKKVSPDYSEDGMATIVKDYPTMAMLHKGNEYAYRIIKKNNWDEKFYPIKWNNTRKRRDV